MEFLTKSAAETKELAGRLAGQLRGGDVILFSGELGAGKTTFIQGLVGALGVKSLVSSPTFVIAHEYQSGESANERYAGSGNESGGFKIHHLDLYRLDDVSELEPFLRDIYLPPSAGGAEILLVEWGEKLKACPAAMPPEYLEITFSFTAPASPDAANEKYAAADKGQGAADERLLVFTPVGESWETRNLNLK